MKYLPQEIEQKWQKKWKKDKVNQFDPKSTEDKFYTLVELPYTSGDLHVGHWFNWAMPDAYSRYKRLQGKNVFFPHGYDAIGLPAENAAIKHKIHPKDWTLKNIETMQKQFETIGSMIDLENITITCSPEYFKWNQWIFIKMYEKGIAYRAAVLSNWCPVDKTVLADEHIEDGKCWRCGSEVVKKEVEQWFLRITQYADQLIWPSYAEASEGKPEQQSDISDQKSAKKPTTDNRKPKTDIDWPESVRTGQNNWIGRSTGLIFTAPVKDTDLAIETFSAHYEACYADTFVVIAPDHPFLEKLLEGVSNKEEIKRFANRLTLKRAEGRVPSYYFFAHTPTAH